MIFLLVLFELKMERKVFVNLIDEQTKFEEKSNSINIRKSFPSETK